MEIRTEVRGDPDRFILSTWDGPNELIDRYEKTKNMRNIAVAYELARQRVTVKRFVKYLKEKGKWNDGESG